MQTLAFIEKLCRLDTGFLASHAQVPDADIARMFGRSVRFIRAQRNRVEYLRMRTQIMTGIALETEQSQAEIATYRKAYFREMLPEALKVVADALQQIPRNLPERKLQLEVAKEIMDREGSFPKISRSDSHVTVAHDYSATDSVVSELLVAMDGPQYKELPKNKQEILTANASFTNSETLSNTQKEEALIKLEEFEPTPSSEGKEPLVNSVLSTKS